MISVKVYNMFTNNNNEQSAFCFSGKKFSTEV